MVSRPQRIWILAAALAAVCACSRPSEPTETPQQPLALVDPCQDVAGGVRATLICGNPQLAELDRTAQETILAEAQSLPPEQARALMQEQTDWLRAQAIACGVVDGVPLSDDQRTCLVSKLRDRVDALHGAVQQAGGFTFRRVEDVDATAVSAAAAAASGLGEFAPTAITREIRYPQIGGDQTPEIARFNTLVRQEPRFALTDQTSEVVNYEIAFASEDLISVRFDLYDEPLSAPHGNVDMRGVTVDMRSGQAITTGDVFREGSGWQNFLTRRAMVELTRAFEGTGFVPAEDDVRETATKPDQWVITQDALVILFPPLSLAGPQVDGGQEVAIPWADLQAYVASGAPAPIRPST